MVWSVNFILEKTDKDISKFIFVREEGIYPAMEAASELLEKDFPEQRSLICGIRLATDQDIPHGYIVEDPVGLEDEDIKMLAWWRAVES